MSRTIAGCDLRIIRGTLGGVADQKGDRSSGGLAFEYTGEDLNLIGFFALGCDSALTRLASVEILLYIRFL